MPPRRLLAAVFAVVALTVASPVAAADVTCTEGAYAMERLELYFGTQRPGGAPVTDSEWASFLDEEVTPRFPDGLTVLRGDGQWRNAKGVVTKETSAVLIILYTPAPEKEAAIEDIRAAYKDRFDQESVMRVDAGTQCVSF